MCTRYTKGWDLSWILSRHYYQKAKSHTETTELFDALDRVPHFTRSAEDTSPIKVDSKRTGITTKEVGMRDPMWQECIYVG